MRFGRLLELPESSELDDARVRFEVPNYTWTRPPMRFMLTWGARPVRATDYPSAWRIAKRRMARETSGSEVVQRVTFTRWSGRER